MRLFVPTESLILREIKKNIYLSWTRSIQNLLLWNLNCFAWSFLMPDLSNAFSF